MSCVSQGLEFLKFISLILKVWIGARFSRIFSKVSMNESNISLPFWFIVLQVYDSAEWVDTGTLELFNDGIPGSIQVGSHISFPNIRLGIP